MEAFEAMKVVTLAAHSFESVFWVKNLALLINERKIESLALHMRNQPVQRVDSRFQSGFGRFCFEIRA